MQSSQCVELEQLLRHYLWQILVFLPETVHFHENVFTQKAYPLFFLSVNFVLCRWWELGAKVWGTLCRNIPRSLPRLTDNNTCREGGTVSVCWRRSHIGSPLYYIPDEETAQMVYYNYVEIIDGGRTPLRFIILRNTHGSHRNSLPKNTVSDQHPHRHVYNLITIIPIIVSTSTFSSCSQFTLSKFDSPKIILQSYAMVHTKTVKNQDFSKTEYVIATQGLSVEIGSVRWLYPIKRPLSEKQICKVTCRMSLCQNDRTLPSFRQRKFSHRFNAIWESNAYDRFCVLIAASRKTSVTTFKINTLLPDASIKFLSPIVPLRTAKSVFFSNRLLRILSMRKRYLHIKNSNYGILIQL
jgi:hypothetical protein